MSRHRSESVSVCDIQRTVPTLEEGPNTRTQIKTRHALSPADGAASPLCSELRVSESLSSGHRVRLYFTSVRHIYIKFTFN